MVSRELAHYVLQRERLQRAGRRHTQCDVANGEASLVIDHRCPASDLGLLTRRWSLGALPSWYQRVLLWFGRARLVW